MRAAPVAEHGQPPQWARDAGTPTAPATKDAITTSREQTEMVARRASARAGARTLAGCGGKGPYARRSIPCAPVVPIPSDRLWTIEPLTVAQPHA